jgi:hypothetical protein
LDKQQEVFDMRLYRLGSVLGIAAMLVLSLKWDTVRPAEAAQNSVGIPAANNLVPSGMHFLVVTSQELNTGKDKVNKKFEARTIEPLETSSGYVIPPGAKIRGHISRIDVASVTGRARLWLTFDDIDTRQGRLPIIAYVSSVPSEFSVRRGESKEGEIEARPSKTSRDLEAAATGAAIGAAAGAANGGARSAAVGAAAGGAAGYVVSSAVGQELDLPKGTKLDLVLDRPLYLTQN